ncbi:MAG: hypothetical protein SCK57_04375 [Bacillota bacterium]|nr:hypothetical protein [Bacillota bacterium]MDW7676877.1 hypothetical protein [Bacillota bacterium]
MMKRAPLLISIVLSIMIILAVSTHALLPHFSLKPLPDPHRTMIPMAIFARTQQPSVSFLLRYWTISRYMDVLYFSVADEIAASTDEITEIADETDAVPSIEPETADPEQSDPSGTLPVDSAADTADPPEMPADLPSPEEILPGNWKASISIDPADRTRFPFPVQRLLVPFEVIQNETGSWTAVISASGQVSEVTFNDPLIFLSLKQTVTLEQVFNITIDLSGELDRKAPLIAGTFQLWVEGDTVPYNGKWQAEKEPVIPE